MLIQLLFIFLARIIDVSLGTIRMILIIRGDKWTAAIIGFFEIMVYTVALGMVVGALDDPARLLVFCAGFAFGVVVGSVIEERLALGYRGVQVIIDREHSCIADGLRAEGFPVTTWNAQGRQGPKMVLNMVVKRQMAGQVSAYVAERDPDAFVVFMEPKQFRGGYLKKK